MKRAASEPAGGVEGFKRRLAHDCFVRIHMTLILAAVVASGVLGSKLLLRFGFHSMRLRYPLAILGSYAVFFLLVRVWIWYVSRVHTRTFGLGNTRSGSGSGSGFSFGGGGGSGSVDIEGGGGSGSFRGFGGGSSGGGGASDVWESDAEADIAAPIQSSSGGGSHWFSGSKGCDLDLGDDWAILLLLAALVLAIVFAGGYLIYVAPSILPEAAWQAALATALVRSTKQADHQNWMSCILRSSAIPFAVILLLGSALGWEAHKHCPQAVKLSQVWYCTVGHPQPPDPDSPLPPTNF